MLAGHAKLFACLNAELLLHEGISGCAWDTEHYTRAVLHPRTMFGVDSEEIIRKMSTGRLQSHVVGEVWHAHKALADVALCFALSLDMH